MNHKTRENIKAMEFDQKSQFITFKNYFLVGIVFLVSESVFADDIMGGLKKANSYARSGAIIISTIAVIGAGLIMTFNKERGFDKMSGAVIGLTCIAGASAIVALIQSFFG